MAGRAGPGIRLWLFLLPLWLAGLAAPVVVALLRAAPGLQAAAGLLAAGVSLMEGLLLARDLGSVRRSFQRAERLEAVFSVIRKAGSSLDLQEVLEAIAHLTVEVTGVRGCSIKLWDTDSGRGGAGEGLSGGGRPDRELDLRAPAPGAQGAGGRCAPTASAAGRSARR